MEFWQKAQMKFSSVYIDCLLSTQQKDDKRQILPFVLYTYIHEFPPSLYLLSCICLRIE